MKLIQSLDKEISETQNLYENCEAAPVNTDLLIEAADILIGNAIAALKAGKNPFETIPGSQETLAGLMLLAKNTNREALNINQKKFDLVSQYVDEKDNIKKYVAQLAQKHGQSLIKNLGAYVAQADKREILTKKLVQLQTAYSQVKQKAKHGEEVSKQLAPATQGMSGEIPQR